MIFLKDLSIRRKLTMVILVTASAALLVTGGALFVFQVVTFRQNFTRDLAALAEIIASHSTGALAFKDKQAADEMLAALKAKSHVVRAEIRHNQGGVFAEYGERRRDEPLVTPADSGVLKGDYLVYAHPIVLDGEKLGMLYLRSDYAGEFGKLLKQYCTILALILSLSIMVTLVLSARLQRVISLPILALAGAAKRIADQKDYSVRVVKQENDEIGMATDAFNQMLREIEEHDAALRVSQQKLQALVHSIDGIVWEADPGTFRFTFVSQQAERILGYSPEDWLATPDFLSRQLHPMDRERVLQTWRDSAQTSKPFAMEFRMIAADRRELWMRTSAAAVLENGKTLVVRGVLLDITEQKNAADELSKLHNELLQTSRQAGMAEVATGVLHNVGNVLNSVNVSVTLINDRLRASKAAGLGKLSELIKQQAHNFGAFISNDAKGRVLPTYLLGLGEKLEQDRIELLKEVSLLVKNIQHIKDIVAMQQSYARVSGVIESLAPSEMIEDALEINGAALARHGIRVVRGYEAVPPVPVDKHKVLQILVNLIRNAKYALDEVDHADKQLTLRVVRRDDFVCIIVEDNGVGIPPENLTRIFSHGFTTRKDGHGFGLHSGALAAKEMGGTLTGYSAGVGKGARFTLELPINRSKANTEMRVAA